MADNITLDPGVTPSVPIATDEAGGFHYQKVKLFDSTGDSTSAVGIKANPISTRSDSGSGILTAITSSATNITLCSSDADIRIRKFYNNANKAAYLKEGVTATAALFTIKILPGGFYETNWRGQIDCIWDSAPTGDMMVAEQYVG